ncbi:hypothetical protein ACJMK2_032834 [Sinanodonta woodiana]|uniref:Kinesin motor domain-containing protein n=1 Tax=Sinanodonta woodiana TaxID=1069815 RepID=A0ABD3X2Z5_SINWO
MPEDKVIPLRVAVRARPLIPKEIDEGCQTCITFVPNEPQLVLGRDRAFSYDYVFSMNDAQETVYELSVKPLVKHIFKGYNATVLAYGQTGSGKTFTMGGGYEASIKGYSDEMGVIPRVLHELFQGMAQREEYEFLTKVSYLEIHNEDLNDLLCPPSKREPLTIREDNTGIKIPGQREVVVANYEETLRCLELGSQSRTTGATAMNNTSSRSHAIFTIIIEQKKKNDIDDFCISKFHLVDLAGSERAKRTQAEGERFKEGVNINKGLLSLGNVISALGDETQKRTHIPYRDSKLTRLLQDSLGGNSHTLMIACVSPADSNLEETLNTLRYADRARKIKNKPVVNRDPQAAEIIRLKQLVQQLQLQLINTGGVIMNQSSGTGPPEDYKSLLEKSRHLEDENEKLTTELQRAIEQSTSLCEKIIRLEMKNERLKERMKEFHTNAGIDLTMLSSSIDAEADPKMKEQLEKLKLLAEKMCDIQTEADESQEVPYVEEEEDVDNDENLPSTPDSRAKSQEHVLRQAKMNKELLELNKLLEKKEQLANQMSQSDKLMSIKTQYEESIKELEHEVGSLQKEKDGLMQALEDAKQNSNATKVSEQRRKRLQELEQQISDLRKKMIEQSKMLKMKDQTDKQVTSLHQEIQNLKQHRVRLMKQMREESDAFRKLKQQKDKEVMQLQQKDRKRQVEISKLQRENQKTQNILKLKSEESWLSHELEILVSIRECKYHLESLLKDRKTIAEHIKELKAKLEDGPPLKKLAWMDDCGGKIETSFEHQEIENQIKTLEQELEFSLLTAISCFHLLDRRGKNCWEALHTMTEAKCACKWLMEQAVSAKTDHSSAVCEMKTLKEDDQDNNQHVAKLEQMIVTLKKKQESEMTRIQKEHENKVLFLLSQIKSGTNNDSTDQDTKKRLQIQEGELMRLNEINDKLQEKTEECESLKQQLTRLMYISKQVHLMPDLNNPGSSPFLSPTPKPQKMLKKSFKSNAKKETQEPVVCMYSDVEEDFEESESDDYSSGEDDPEYVPTPLQRRVKLAEKRRPSKRSSIGARCACKSKCMTNKCSCRKNGVSCQNECGCITMNCVNRESEQPHSTTNTELETSEGSSVINSTFVYEEKENSSTSPEILQTSHKTHKILGLIQKDDSGQRSSDEFILPGPLMSRKSAHSVSSLGDESLSRGLKRRKLLPSKQGSFFEPL